MFWNLLIPYKDPKKGERDEEVLQPYFPLHILKVKNNWHKTNIPSVIGFVLITALFLRRGETPLLTLIKENPTGQTYLFTCVVFFKSGTLRGPGCT